MTQPDPTVYGATVPDAEALAYEAAAVAVVTAAAEAALLTVVGRALAAYAAGVSGAALAGRLASGLRFARWPPMAPALRRVAIEARQLGTRRALRDLRELDVIPDPAPLPDLPDPDRAVADAAESAAYLAELLPLTTKRDLLAVQGRVNKGLSIARGHARWAANEGINSGVADVARAAGLRLLWIAERNACLHCLAHAGYAVEVGDAFPILSYDPVRPASHGAVTWPPLHPNCRCQVRAYEGPAGPPPIDRSAVDPAARLAAEARRSVVYQWSDYASGVRLRAAAGHLLDAGAELPASVERRAKSALRRGKIVDKPR